MDGRSPMLTESWLRVVSITLRLTPYWYTSAIVTGILLPSASVLTTCLPALSINGTSANLARAKDKNSMRPVVSLLYPVPPSMRMYFAKALLTFAYPYFAPATGPYITGIAIVLTNADAGAVKKFKKPKCVRYVVSLFCLAGSSTVPLKFLASSLATSP